MWDALFDFVETLHVANARHVKRGCGLQEVTPLQCSCRTIEEMVEAQAEIIQSVEGEDPNTDAVLEELGDVLATYMHLLVLLGIAPHIVENVAIKKLQATFSTNRADVKTQNPGFTRRNREQ